MKSLLSLLAGMVLAVGAWLVWSFATHEPTRRGPQNAPGIGDEAFQLEIEAREEERRQDLRSAGVPGFMIGQVSTVKPKTERLDGLPEVMGQIELLSWGRNIPGSNTPEMKMALARLRVAMETMTPEEQARLAQYFTESDDPTTKYWLLIAFRSWGGEAYVDAVRNYYFAEPDMVSEALSYMMGRTEKAVAAFESILEEEFDPLRRAQVVSRAGFLGVENGEELMRKVFRNAGKSAEKRLALWGLARIRNESTRELVWDVIDGPYERAVYAIGENRESDDEMKDLRCQAVVAMLLNGSQDDIQKLFDRARAGEGDIAHYVDRYFSVVNDQTFVPQVVDLLMERQEVDERYLIYFANQAKLEHRSDLEKLFDLDLDPDDRKVLNEIVDRMN